MRASFESIVIFSDGACTGNPGPGGWGTIVAHPQGHVRELGGHEPHTTNNRMELTGSLRGLASVESPAQSPIEIFTDSTYVIRGITQWIRGWRKRGWKNAEGNDVANRDLWEALELQVSRLEPARIQWSYVRGHTGIPGNERCDEIAVAFANGESSRLYEGPLLGYGVPLYDLPDEPELPPVRTGETSKKKEPAYSYLSVLGGRVVRHRTWKECENRVKGQPNVRFKKASSAQNEREILKGWGFDPDTTHIQE
ncbi:MAG: ribonuclease HI [Acidobacteriota bacterium]